MQKVDKVCLDPEQRSEGPLGTVGVGKGVAGPQWRWSRGLTGSLENTLSPRHLTSSNKISGSNWPYLQPLVEGLWSAFAIIRLKASGLREQEQRQSQRTACGPLSPGRPGRPARPQGSRSARLRCSRNTRPSDSRAPGTGHGRQRRRGRSVPCAPRRPPWRARSGSHRPATDPRCPGLQSGRRRHCEAGQPGKRYSELLRFSKS